MNRDVNSVIQVRDLILPGQVTVLAGRPGIGKTALACDLISQCGNSYMPVYITHHEHPDSIMQRLSDRGNVPCTIFNWLGDAMDSIIDGIVSRPFVVFDFLPYEESDQYSGLLNDFKALAIELNFPILLILPLPRTVDARDNKRPLLSDLPMKNSMEFIDNVILLYREDYYTGEATGTAEAIIVKSPSGETMISLSWDVDRATFL